MALLAAVSAAVAAPASTSAGVIVTFAVEPFGEGCIELSGPPNILVDISLRRGGELRDAAVSALNAVGTGFSCLDTPVLPGDQLKAKWGMGAMRSFDVPNVTILTNRVTDVVSGKAPASSSITVSLRSNNLPVPVGPIDHLVATSAAGTYSTDFTAERNMRGADDLTVFWQDAAGDSVEVSSVVPGVIVAIRSPVLIATLDRFRSSTFTLRTSGGATRSVLTGRADEQGEVEGTFWQDPAGDLISAVVGDRVSATFATDATFQIPNVIVSSHAGDDTVSGQCLPGRRYIVSIAQNSGFRIGTSDAAGAYSEDFTGTYDIQVGDVAVVRCVLGSGDMIQRKIRATL